MRYACRPFPQSAAAAVVFFVCLLNTSVGDDWKTLTIPDAWRSVPTGDLTPINGYSWYRTLVRIPKEWSGDELTIFLEALDDARSAWVGGQQVGATGTFPPQYRSGLGERGRFQVLPELVSAGDYVTVAIRVYQNDPRPNFSVAPPVLMNERRKEAFRLEGIWQYRPGDDSTWARAAAADFGIAADQELSAAEAAAKGICLSVDTVDEIEKYVARRKGDTDPLAPAEAVRHFTTPADLAVELVLGDPDIAQPLFMSWDGRGRLWVMEYRQYPDPAGLKMVSRDTFLRSVYDKIPQAPPNHVRGADRISIHADSDGDGSLDQHTVFVDGLNIATSFAIGRGGVFVTNPPYLLYYPDHNQDDIPDSDPEVLLEGFGIEDSHSVINSLRFGPDGWLYGAQGSTVTGVVRKPGSKDPPIRSQGQLIWRYHPEQKNYEIFAEGGGNTFGCEIDDKGRIFSGHNGGDTRGFHYVQGGYYRKGFGKHGPLSNPYAFGYFENMKHHSVPRFTHNFVIYEEGRLPERFKGLLFGIEPLQGQVVLSHFRPFQSSFETEDIERVLKTDDPWFRPVDIKTGPDGAVYVADMYEQRIDHSSHYAGRVDKTNGRIYRLVAAGSSRTDRTGNTTESFADYDKMSSAELVKLLDHPSKWHRQTAVRILGDRQDSSIIPQLKTELEAATGQSALERLWAIAVTGGLADADMIHLLSHRDPFVRAWTVRLACDPGTVSPEVASAIRQAASGEAYLDVRKQMACSARRIPPELALPILHELIRFDEDAADIHQPLLIWWAIEASVGRTTVDQIVGGLLEHPESWNRPLIAGHVAERLMKRYALAGKRDDLVSAARLLRAAPDKLSVERLLKGFEDAFQGRSLAGIPDELADALAGSGGGSLALRFRQAQPDAVKEAVSLIRNSAAAKDVRQQLIEISGQTRQKELLPLLLEIAAGEQDSAVLAATYSALQNFEDPQIAETVVSRLNQLNGDAQLAAEAMLSSRAIWSKLYVAAVKAGTIPKIVVSDSALRRMQLHGDPEIQDAIRSLWGEIGGISPAQVQEELARVNAALSSGSGNPRNGKPLFMQNCGRCHVLFDEGGRIGPDLTPFARDQLERMLSSVINPSLEIREGFENHLVVTDDGRVLNGFLADKDSQVVILRGVEGQNVILRTESIEEMKVVPQSVMPEGTLKNYTDQQLRDLFAYLRSTQPVN